MIDAIAEGGWLGNFRDLGGHSTRSGRRLPRGRLFRSGHLGHASDTDRETLRGLGLRKVFDFRTDSDITIFKRTPPTSDLWVTSGELIFIATGRPTVRDILLPAEVDQPIPAVTAAHKYFGFIKKHRCLPPLSTQ